MYKKAVFLDRDGTINKDTCYVNKPEELIVYDFAPKALHIFDACGFVKIVISNQSGIARDYFSEKDLDLITDAMEKYLNKYNTTIDEYYYSFYHPKAVDKKYLEGAEFRKPNPGMILKAVEKYDIDLKKSYMIGDKESDIGAGINAGCRTILIKSEKEKEYLKKLADNTVEFVPDYICDNLLEAAELIQNETT